MCYQCDNFIPVNINGRKRSFDKINHANRTMRGIQIMKNKLTRAIMINNFNFAKSKGLSNNDVSDISKSYGLVSSTKTISSLTPRLRNVMQGRTKFYNNFKNVVGKRFRNSAKWINYILGTNQTNIDSVLEQIEKDIEPP